MRRRRLFFFRPDPQRDLFGFPRALPLGLGQFSLDGTLGSLLVVVRFALCRLIRLLMPVGFFSVVVVKAGRERERIMSFKLLSGLWVVLAAVGGCLALRDSWAGGPGARARPGQPRSQGLRPPARARARKLGLRPRHPTPSGRNSDVVKIYKVKLSVEVVVLTC